MIILYLILIKIIIIIIITIYILFSQSIKEHLIELKMCKKNNINKTCSDNCQSIDDNNIIKEEDNNIIKEDNNNIIKEDDNNIIKEEDIIDTYIYMTLFYTTEKYPKMKIIEENYEIIKNEIPEFYIDNIKIQRKVTEWGDNGIDLVKTLENNQDWLFSMHSIDVWFAYPLMYNNNPIGLAEKICPNTIKILKSLGNIKTCGFALIYPNSSLNIHCDDVGPTYNSMGFNMLLTGFNSDLSIYYNNKKYKHIHQNGKAVIFNSELCHNASNNGSTNRVIIYIDFSTN